MALVPFQLMRRLRSKTAAFLQPRTILWRLSNVLNSLLRDQDLLLQRRYYLQSLYDSIPPCLPAVNNFLEMQVSFSHRIAKP